MVPELRVLSSDWSKPFLVPFPLNSIGCVFLGQRKRVEASDESQAEKLVKVKLGWIRIFLGFPIREIISRTGPVC